MKILIGSLFALAVSAKNGIAIEQPKPWELTTNERIAVRTDRAAAKTRIQNRSEDLAELRQRDAGKFALLVDLIDGNRNPELFLPTELFEDAVKLGLVPEDNWQPFWEAGVRDAGLPPDFWTRLSVVAQPFIEDLQLRNGILERGRQDSRAQSESQTRLAGLSVILCRSRADSYQRAREMFGPALDRFLYSVIARGASKAIFDTPETADDLRAHAGGCR